MRSALRQASSPASQVKKVGPPGLEPGMAVPKTAVLPITPWAKTDIFIPRHRGQGSFWVPPGWRRKGTRPITRAFGARPGRCSACPLSVPQPLGVVTIDALVSHSLAGAAGGVKGADHRSRAIASMPLVGRDACSTFQVRCDGPHHRFGDG